MKIQTCDTVGPRVSEHPSKNLQETLGLLIMARMSCASPFAVFCKDNLDILKLIAKLVHSEDEEVVHQQTVSARSTFHQLHTELFREHSR